MNHKIYARFEKAFGKLKHDNRVEILKAKYVNSHDARIIVNLY